MAYLLVTCKNQCATSCTPLPLQLDTDANCCTQQPQLHSATHTAGQHRAGNDKHIDRTEKYRKCLPAMQLSLQLTYSLVSRKMKPKHCVSNSTYCNQSSEHQTHYTNCEQFESFLNYRIKTIGNNNEKKLFLVSDGGSTRRSVSTLLPKTFLCQQFVNTNPNTWNVKMRRIWRRSVCIGSCFFSKTPK